MSTENSVTVWLNRLKAGDVEATERIWNRYFLPVIRVARRKLRGLPLAAADEEDVAVAAFKSFYAAVARQNLPRLENRDDLWNVLFALTTRKAIAQRRLLGAQKRGGDEAGNPATPQPLEETVLEDLLSREPDPQFALLVEDEVLQLLNRLPEEHPQLRRIALLKLEGYTNEEIAQSCECRLRTVERRLWVIRQIWNQNLSE
jgi:DNA-directed RNA polymerase specialized sigma24 family protein